MTASPYYIVSPRWIGRSAGVKTLHLLCAELGARGCSAHMLLADAGSESEVEVEGRRVPVLTPDILERHFAAGIAPIVVYPEVVTGNPYDAPIVVRYVLNYPGALGGNTHYAPEELVYGYSGRLVAAAGRGDVLFVPPIDERIYHRDGDDRPRSGSCYYAAKFKAKGGRVFGLPEDCVEILRDGDGVQTPAELAELFRGSEVFYTFEDTALILEAALCGCPTVFLLNEIFDRPLGDDEFGAKGIAFSDRPEDLAEARRTQAELVATYDAQKTLSHNQIDDFVEATQRHAAGRPYLRKIRLVSLNGRGQIEFRALLGLLRRLTGSLGPATGLRVFREEIRRMRLSVVRRTAHRSGRPIPLPFQWRPAIRYRGDD